MRSFVLLVVVVLAAPFVSAQDLGRSLPTKSDIHVMSNPASDLREGGETVADAYPMGAVPWNDGGATCDNVHDYDEVCPYSGSTSPDVVYSWTSAFDGGLFVDLCGSQYDTKLYMYDSGMNLVDCNDDAYFDEVCGDYVSALEQAPVVNGETYFIVVDGYGGDCGEYVIAAAEHEPPPPCDLPCPDGAQLEGEPPLVDGYVDNYNGGCGSQPPVFQWIECADFCGVTGWYTISGTVSRDTDWFICTAAAEVVIWTVDAESATYCFQLYNPDCNVTEVVQTMTAGRCSPGTMTILTEPGTVLDLWCGSSNFANPGDVVGNEYDYIMHIDGIVEVSSTRMQTWSGVKSLYR